MRMSTYLVIIALGMLIAVYANADQPGNYPQQPPPVDQYQTEQCPPGMRTCAPAVQVYSVVCELVPLGGWMAILQNGFEIYRGPRIQAEVVIRAYIRNGTCPQVAWRLQ